MQLCGEFDSTLLTILFLISFLSSVVRAASLYLESLIRSRPGVRISQEGLFFL